MPVTAQANVTIHGHRGIIAQYIISMYMFHAKFLKRKKTKTAVKLELFNKEINHRKFIKYFNKVIKSFIDNLYSVKGLVILFKVF